MPTISMFYGIIIRMYCAPGEHNPPHIHAYYQDYKAIINIKQCELTEGALPRKKERLVLAWVEIAGRAARRLGTSLKWRVTF